MLSIGELCEINNSANDIECLKKKKPPKKIKKLSPLVRRNQIIKFMGNIARPKMAIYDALPPPVVASLLCG